MRKFLIIIAVVVGVNLGGVFSSADVDAYDSSGASDTGGASDDAYERDTEIAEGLPEIFIKAVNPGYTIAGISNVGEMIEIGRKNSDEMMSLAGLNVSYTNSSGNTALIADLSKYLFVTGETILLRLASSPENELASLLYSKTLAFKAGPLELIRDGEVVDSVCWTGKEGCVAAFNSAKPTTLVRNLATGEFEHLSIYEPDYNEDSLKIIEEPEENGGEVPEVASQCKGVVFSEILSYYESSPHEQFIEFYNGGTESVALDGCQVRYKNKNYPLSGIVEPEGYMVRYLDDFKLTKNPTTSNILELIDTNGDVLDRLEYYNGQRKGTSYAFVGYDSGGGELWRITYAPTPGEPNNYQEYRVCEVGKVLNEATGNCVKVTSVAEKICGEGQYLNILTGRCRKIEESDSGTKECKEGYYYYEETGRCRKIKENDGTDYALVPETYTEESSFVALYLILGALAIGLIYMVYEFRHEIMRVVRRIKARFM